MTTPNRFNRLLFLPWLLLGTTWVLGLPLCAEERCELERLRTHATFMASEACEGRLSGSAGCARTAEYIEGQFRQWDLLPGGTMDGERRSYLQSFPFPGVVRLGEKNSLRWSMPGEPEQTLKLHREFIPLRFSESLAASENMEVVFAGYGISDTQKGYDDYAGLDVNGKCVLVFRGEPETPDGKRIGKETADPHALPSVHADIFYKASTAKEKRAKALLLMTGYRHTKDNERVELMVFNQGARNNTGLPILQLITPAVAPWFGGEAQLKATQEKIDTALQPASRSLTGLKLQLEVDLQREKGQSENVLGYIPGQDPKLKDEILVIGAHYDHLGRGNEFSLADKDALGVQIHYGADDNASGTASLLELARLLSLRKADLKRTVWFMAFSGEELGTIGSHFLVRNPPTGLEISKVTAMVNLDMVGRARDNKLLITGVGTGTGFKELLDEVNQSYRFDLKPTEDGFGGSDHLQFTNAAVPVLFFFTGTHEDYHKPSDTVDKLNLTEQRRITDLVLDLSLRLNRQETRPEFIKLEPQPRAVAGMGGIRLGTLPDYAYDGKGMAISGTRKDSPADKAGMQKGDVIVMLAGHSIENIYDYMNALRQCKPGEPIELVVLREGKKLTLKAEPQQQ